MPSFFLTLFPKCQLKLPNIMCLKTLAGILLIAAISNSCMTKQKADLILHNATIYTVDESFSKQEAMAVKDGVILAVGSSEDIMQNYQAASSMDLDEDKYDDPDIEHGYLCRWENRVGIVCGSGLASAIGLPDIATSEDLDECKQICKEDFDNLSKLTPGWTRD